MTIYESAIKKPVTYMMIFIAITAVGIVSLIRLKPELLPDISFPVIAVITRYEGVGPEDIETLITRPIETAVSTVNRVKEVSSTCSEGSSMVIIQFEWGTNIDIASLDVREKVDQVKRFLPEDAETPMVFRFDPTMFPITLIGMSGEINLGKLRKLAEEKIQPAIERAEGVAGVTVLGGLEREIQINLDRKKMDSLGLSVQNVINTISQENLDLPVGTIKETKKEYLIRSLGEFRSLNQIEDIVLVSRTGMPVYIRDIGEVKDLFKEPQNITLINGKPGVMLMVRKRSGANTVAAVDNVKKELKNLKKILPAGINFQITMDQSEFIKKAIGNLVESAWQGGLLCILVILFFLRDWRSTLIISLSIPISVIACFTALFVAGITLNVMSLGGLALAVGMLVDNSIVVLENIFTHRMEENEPLREAAVWGTSEVAMAITASTLTTIVVFLPIFFAPGIARELFKEQALTVVLSLLISLFVAVTLVPLLTTKLFKEETNSNPKNKKGGILGNISGIVGKILDSMSANYEKLLTWAVGHRKIVVFGTFGIFIVSILPVYPFRFVGTEFMPKTDEGSININLELPVGTKLEITEGITRKIEAIVRENVPEIKFLRSQIGPGGWLGGGSRSGPHVASIGIELVDLKQRKRSQWGITADLRKKLTGIPGAKINMGGSSGGGRMTMMGMGGAAPISIEIYGHDLDRSLEVAERIKNMVKETPGTSDVDISLEKSKPEFQMIINRKRASDLGLNVATISKTLQSYIYGTQASLFREGGDEFPITVRLKETDRSRMEELQNLPIITPKGQKVSIGSLVSFQPSLGPTTIARKEQERVVTVNADYEGRDLGSVTQNIEGKLKNIVLPPSFFIKTAGEVKEQRESFKWLGLALIGAIFLIYAVMAAQFESLLDPFMIMFTIPLALIGVIWLFFFTGTNFNILGLVGVILLAGIIVNNGIVLVDYTNLLRARGIPLREAVIQAGVNRLRPVLMTALTTIVGLLPMSLGIGEGAELRTPLARAVAGGLTVGTFLTLIFIPVLYTIFETHVKKEKNKK